MSWVALSLLKATLLAVGNMTASSWWSHSAPL